MAFRADEAASSRFQEVKNYLVPRDFDPKQREEAEAALQEIVSDLGPAVDGYPTWHPLVANHDGRHPETYPSDRCGYIGLDHTRYFAHGFITCPYDDGQRVIDSAQRLLEVPCASISAERLDVPFYSQMATPILVRCKWSEGLEQNLTIPKRWAVPLMLEQELPVWRWAQRAETWETMRPYLLGRPHGNRSSLFVTQETAIAIKGIYLAMTESGMFGPLKG
ncbi:hypothetical protein [Caulobacter sp. NIBR2454]|uniref:hypothetical protein n=1 Tax=Caulobacter sp. NIBR2454 TaxID=3015996 RepID=UPI0022B74EBA|nr:hypothetical protein [Caulobacter sp. NIBR2454]